MKDFLKKMENIIINEHKKNKIGLFSQKVFFIHYIFINDNKNNF